MGYFDNPKLDEIMKMIENDAADEELADKLQQTTFPSDEEVDHMCTDEIMEALLIKMGYKKTVNEIRSRLRRYA